MLCAQRCYSIRGTKGDGVKLKVHWNINTSDLVPCLRNLVQQVRKFAKGEPHQREVPKSTGSTQINGEYPITVTMVLCLYLV